MALEPLDTKGAGVIQPDSALPKPASRRLGNGSGPAGGQYAFVVVVHRENQGARSEFRSACVTADPQAVGLRHVVIEQSHISPVLRGVQRLTPGSRDRQARSDPARRRALPLARREHRLIISEDQRDQLDPRRLSSCRADMTGSFAADHTDSGPPTSAARAPA
jgi:hypothetical protein